MAIITYYRFFTIVSPPQYHYPLISNVNAFSSLPTHFKFRIHSSSISNSLSASSPSPFSSSSPVLEFRRRLLNFSIVAVIFVWDPIFGSLSNAITDAPELQRYTDSKEGFTLLVPSSWVKVDKAGATLLFEESGKGSSNNVGVVVTPVRISRLGDFGSPQFVSEKLIQAEKRKESTKSAEVISVSERLGQDGLLQVYEFEYKVDSTRGGMKRVFSAAFVASKKLYLLNISYTDGLEKTLDLDKRMLLEKVLHSFDVAPTA